MATLTATFPVEQLDALDTFASTEVDAELRDVLFALSGAARAGQPISVDFFTEVLSPNQVATRLGMSRTHLYKLLDSGEIPFHRVGRDRRIQLRDLVEFEAQRQAGRRELAERFAHQAQTRNAVIDELVDMM